MGVDSKRAGPPLPAPTETDSASVEGTELATEVSRATDKTSYSVPEDGSPITISTRKNEPGLSDRKGHLSQTSLLIEYFEGGKGPNTESRRPSVRVKVTPSSKSRSRSANDHIQITETKGTRRPSYTKRINLSTPDHAGEREGDDRSVSSFASATGESNLTSRSGHPIEIELRPRSPLIPHAESARFVQLGSDVSSMPADSFLDGKTRSPERRSRNMSTSEVLAAGAASGAAAAVIVEGLKTPSRRRSRSLSRERLVAQKAVEKVRGERSERRHKHKETRSRSVSNSEKNVENVKSPQRKSSRSRHEESLVSGADSSRLTASQVSADQRSFRSGTSKSSINNPKLLETVEDAIRRLILPELSALKKEQKSLKKSERARRGSYTSPTSSGISQETREDLSSRRVSGRSSTPETSGRTRDAETVRLRKTRKTDRAQQDSPRSSEVHESEDTVIRDGEKGHRERGVEKGSKLGGGTGSPALTAAALHGHNSQEHLDERQERRRRRKEQNQSESTLDSFETGTHHQPRMPMMSDVNASDITRSSILSAETERPLSASEEYRKTPIREVSRGVASPTSITPARANVNQHPLRLLHDNSSSANLHRNVSHEQREMELNDEGQKGPMNGTSESYNQSQNDRYGRKLQPSDRELAAEAAAITASAGGLVKNMQQYSHGRSPSVDEDEEDAYRGNEQEVPSPLRYVPYNQQRRGLSPIPQSVYSYKEGEDQKSRIAHSASYSTLDRSPQHKASAATINSEVSHQRNTGHRDSEYTQDSEYWDEQHRENDRNRQLEQDGYGHDDAEHQDKHMSGYSDETANSHFSDKVSAGQNVRGIGANPDYVHMPFGVESAVASLVSASALTTNSETHSGHNRAASYASYDEGSERHFTSRGNSPMKHQNVSREVGYNEEAHDADDHNDQYPEYELDENGRKITMPDYRRRRDTEEVLPIGAASAAAASSYAHAHETHSSPGDQSFEDREIPFRNSTYDNRSNHSEYNEYPSDKLNAVDGHQDNENSQQELDPTTHARFGNQSEKNADRSTTTRTRAPGKESPSVHSQMNEEREFDGPPLQKSFKDRAMERRDAFPSPQHSVDRFNGSTEDHQAAHMGKDAAPDVRDPMPEIGWGQEEDSDAASNSSVIHEPMGDSHHASQKHWSAESASPSGARRHEQTMEDRHQDSDLHEAEDGLLGAAASAGAAAAIAGHDRGTNVHDDQWQRTSDERKRDTLVTNPYEGTSPIGAQHDRSLLDNLNMKYNPTGYTNGEDSYSVDSPSGMQKVDEGYISGVQNARSPNAATRTKGVDFMDAIALKSKAEDFAGEDPFYNSKHLRHMSGMSHGMGSPNYEGATGQGIDRIQSKDIVALMDHLTVRDAQRSARDTEILVTLVRAAAEMRNSFEDMKRLLADTEDVIITEVQRNTEKSVQKVINGPRPLPPGSARSIRGSEDMISDIPNKKKNVFRRALKGLSMRSSNDLQKIEEMLMQLLGEVEGLKYAQGLSKDGSMRDQYDGGEHDGSYEQDRGYEPEGNAGTSEASHPSQSGRSSAPMSRGPSGSRGFEGRKFSDHRISTVDEAEEDELDEHEQAVLRNQFENNERLLTPTREKLRADSPSLNTPPQQRDAPDSPSEDRTPVKSTDKSKKQKSGASFGWNPIPKISRWSETTASTVARGFRSSGRNSGKKDGESYGQPPSRSGSDLGNYDGANHDTYGDDKLHSGFSQDHLDSDEEESPRQLTSLLPPEDPKYKAHRNSLNLQHPQPRPGPTRRYQTALETQAEDYDGPLSPKSPEWTPNASADRLPQNANYNRFSNTTTQSAGRDSPVSEHDFPSDSPGGNLAPSRPPKEPMSSHPGPERPAKIRNKLTKPSPLSNERLQANDQEDVDASILNRYSHSSASQERRTGGNNSKLVQSPRNPSASMGVPSRKPTGPRSMGSPRSGNNSSVEDATIGRNKNRDTFGTIKSHTSGDSETF